MSVSKRGSCDEHARPTATTLTTMLTFRARNFVFKIGGQVVRGHAHNLRRSFFRQRPEKRCDCRLKLNQARENFVVLAHAELNRIRLRSGPRHKTCRACDTMKHVYEFGYLSIFFHSSFLPLKISNCSRSKPFPLCTLHLIVESGTPRNAAILLSGISSRKCIRSASA